MKIHGCYRPDGRERMKSERETGGRGERQTGRDRDRQTPRVFQGPVGAVSTLRPRGVRPSSSVNTSLREPGGCGRSGSRSMGRGWWRVPTPRPLPPEGTLETGGSEGSAARERTRGLRVSRRHRKASARKEAVATRPNAAVHPPSSERQAGTRRADPGGAVICAPTNTFTSLPENALGRPASRTVSGHIAEVLSSPHPQTQHYLIQLCKGGSPISRNQTLPHSQPCKASFPGSSDAEESSLQGKRRGFDPWVGKIPWRRRAWQPSSVFLPGEPHGQRSPVGCSP